MYLTRPGNSANKLIRSVIGGFLKLLAIGGVILLMLLISMAQSEAQAVVDTVRQDTLIAYHTNTVVEGQPQYDSDIVRPEKFGANPLDNLPDSEAIQRMLNQLEDQRGGLVRFRTDGKYIIDKPLFYAQTGPTTFIAEEADFALLVHGTAFSFNIEQLNTQIEQRLTWRGGFFYGAGFSNAFRTDAKYLAHFTLMTFSNIDSAFSGSWVMGSLFGWNKFTNVNQCFHFDAIAKRQYHSSTTITVIGNRLWAKNANGFFSAARGYGFNIERNIVEGPFCQRPIYLDFNSSGVCKLVTIRGNHFEGGSLAAITLRRGNGTTVVIAENNFKSQVNIAVDASNEIGKHGNVMLKFSNNFFHPGINFFASEDERQPGTFWYFDQAYNWKAKWMGRKPYYVRYASYSNG